MTSAEIESNNFVRLLSIGIDTDDAVELAVHAVEVYDRNRKPRGASNGPVGMMGREVYTSLCQTPDYDPDPQAFITYRPYTAETVAERIVRSRNVVGSAVTRLIEHGFIDRRREGRSFFIRLLIPAIALMEYGEHYIDVFEPGMSGYEHHRPLAKKMLSLYPRETFTEEMDDRS